MLEVKVGVTVNGSVTVTVAIASAGFCGVVGIPVLAYVVGGSCVVSGAVGVAGSVFVGSGLAEVVVALGVVAAISEVVSGKCIVVGLADGACLEEIGGWFVVIGTCPFVDVANVVGSLGVVVGLVMVEG
eukprot:scpid21454/ scgid10672/ 